ncbi:TIGR02117 family protein [Stratiformator vulcanicus]|uniref:TIGR02117 family protein n=1 Tax=Stratiformator vulcanicus TaxID=2527980 RepID=UPI0028775C62|nr:TIGR02117 family protein [Stratiformator vulcanicus]
MGDPDIESEPKQSLLKKIVLSAVGVLAIPVVAIAVGQIPVNLDHREADDGIEIFVYADIAHSEVFIPRKTDLVDWGDIFSLTDIRVQPDGGDYIGIGWGDRDFYPSTPQWSDVRLGPTLKAILWPTPTVLHVTHSPRPKQSDHFRRVMLSRDAYLRLVQHVKSYVAAPMDGAATVLPGAAYGPADAFYEARGNYTLFYTCNAWANDVVKSAGVRTSLWTPLAIGIGPPQ